MMYYVARDGQQYGPYSAETVKQYLAERSLLVTDMAREETGQSWQTLGQFFPPAVPLPPTVPPYPGDGRYPGPQVMVQVIPPDLHWAVVLLLGCTGVFTFVWALIQSSYARKIDPTSKATVLFVLWVIGSVFNFFLYIGFIAAVMENNGHVDSDMSTLLGVIALLGLGCWILVLTAVFSIRRSMLEYYNTREPIQLQLSGVMTFFFSILYLQYHMSRIARWKRTGYLTA